MELKKVFMSSISQKKKSAYKSNYRLIKKSIDPSEVSPQRSSTKILVHNN